MIEPARAITDRARLRLARREGEVVELSCIGASNGKIAPLLGIGLPTVKMQLIHIFNRLRVENHGSVAAFVRNL